MIRPGDRLPLPAVAAPQPGEVNYSALSPHARETMAQVVLRLTAGWDLQEIADELSRERPELRNWPLPKKITRGWLSREMKQLRAELVDSVEPL